MCSRCERWIKLNRFFLFSFFFKNTDVPFSFTWSLRVEDGWRSATLSAVCLFFDKIRSNHKEILAQTNGISDCMWVRIPTWVHAHTSMFTPCLGWNISTPRVPPCVSNMFFFFAPKSVSYSSVLKVLHKQYAKFEWNVSISWLTIDLLHLMMLEALDNPKHSWSYVVEGNFHL